MEIFFGVGMDEIEITRMMGNESESGIKYCRDGVISVVTHASACSCELLVGVYMLFYYLLCYENQMF